MEESSVVHNTFVIERSFAKPPERVFAAFVDPTKKRRWFGEGSGRSVERFEMDFRVGGAERSSFRMGPDTPFPGVLLTNEGHYEDIVPERRLVLSYSMTMGDHRISTSLLTFEFAPKDGGTDLVCTHQGVFFEHSDGPQMREGGWRRLLDNLDKTLASD